jgi:hypothetical protein
MAATDEHLGDGEQVAKCHRLSGLDVFHKTEFVDLLACATTINYTIATLIP